MLRREIKCVSPPPFKSICMLETFIRLKYYLKLTSNIVKKKIRKYNGFLFTLLLLSIGISGFVLNKKRLY
jgi:hypothetical protein